MVCLIFEQILHHSCPKTTHTQIHSGHRNYSFIKRRGNIEAKEQRESEREGFGFQERHTLISKCFFALSACLTKAPESCAGESAWWHSCGRWRQEGFLALCSESQPSNIDVCHSAEQAIECGSGNNAFFPSSSLEDRVAHVVVDHLALRGCSLTFSTAATMLEAAAEVCTRGFTWAHGRKQTLLYLLVCPEKSPAKSLRSSPDWIY